jgi:hypothetical protein
MRCSKCGSEPDNSPFQPVAPLAGAEEALPSADSASGERRHLTVRFCDLVNSTSIAAQLDPEEWREKLGAYHRTAAEAITRYSGHAAKYLGDGVMAYFGWPEAHENDAERATRAGLAVLKKLSKLNQQSTPAKSVGEGWNRFRHGIAKTIDDVPWCAEAISPGWLIGVLYRGIESGRMTPVERGRSCFEHSQESQGDLQSSGENARPPEDLFCKTTPKLTRRRSR